MQAARSLRLAATVALSAIVATLAIAAPMADPALAGGKPQPTPTPVLNPPLPANPTNATSATFAWNAAANTAYTCTLDGTRSTCTPPAGSNGSISYGPGLVDGSHTFVLKAQLAPSGGTRYKASSASYSWTVDTTPPSSPTVDPLPTPTKNTSAVITWTDADPTAVAYKCALDDSVLADATTCSSGWAVGPLSDASHTAYVYALDALGNEQTTAGTVSWVVDTTAPSSPVITITPPSPTNNTSATVSWTDGDATTFTCVLDANPPVSCTSPWYVPGPVSDGTHVVTVQGVDAAGNVGAPGSAYWIVDSTPPPAPLIMTGPASTTDQTAATFDFQDADTSATFSCSLDGISYSPCTSPTTYTMTAPSSPSTYTFYVKATDAAGNTGQATTWTWTIDPTVVVSPPQIRSGPNALTNLPSASFTFDSLDGATTFSCSVDGSVPVDCSTGSYQPTVIGDGTHVFSVTETTVDGTSAPATWTWTLDTTPPAAPTFSSTPAQVSNVVSPLFSFADEANVTYTCSLDSGTPIACMSPTTLKSLTDGPHTLAVTATDAAGNTSAASAATYSWTVDTAPPAAPGVTGPDPSGTTATLSLSDTSADTASYLCALNSSKAVGCSSTQAFSNLPVGMDYVTVQAVDQAGNVSGATSYSWTVDGTAPSTPTIDSGPSSLTGSASADLSFSMPDASATHLQCWLDNQQTLCTTSTPTGGTMHLTQLADRAHTFSVVAVNSLGNSTSSIPWNWTVDTTAPAAPSVSGPSGLVNSATSSFSYSDTSSDVASYTCYLDGAFQGVCAASYTVGDGNHTLVAYATDAVGNVSPASTPVTWTVNTTASAPTQPSNPSTADTTAPTVTSLTAIRSLAGTSTATFSETVHGLSAGGAALYANASTVVPASVKCLSGTTVVACSGSFTSLQVRPRSALVPGEHYSVRLAAGAVQDAVGNPLVARSVYFRGSLNEQETSLAAGPTWATVRTTAAYGRSYVRENLSGASATYSFTGPRITWWTVTGRDQGKAAVYVDGKRRAVVDNYAAATHYKVARKFTRLGNKRHTIRIVVLGVKGAQAGTGTFVSVDAFTVGTKRTNTPALTMAWHVAANRHFSGGYAITANMRGETVSFRFRGTSIAWFTQKARNQGKVAVYVDGVRKAVVDNYSLTTGFGVKRVVSKLANTLHTLRLVVLGTHHKGGTGTWLTVDRFLVG